MARLYSSIPHLPGSRAAEDRMLSPSQAARFLDPSRAIASEVVIVQEKLDGSCVAIRRGDDGASVVALGREGNLAASSKNEGRRMFAVWVEEHTAMLRAILEGAANAHADAANVTLVGEWLALVHGTRYELAHAPFVPFDLLVQREEEEEPARVSWDELASRMAGTDLVMPAVIHRGAPIAIAEALDMLGPHGRHHAIDPPEGLVYRVERQATKAKKKVGKKTMHVMVAKWVNPNKVDGAWLPENTGKAALYHWRPRPL